MVSLGHVDSLCLKAMIRIQVWMLKLLKLWFVVWLVMDEVEGRDQKKKKKKGRKKRRK